MAPPNNIKQLRSFLGMITYLSKFVKNLSDEAKVLRDLEKKGTHWRWNEKY